MIFGRVMGQNSPQNTNYCKYGHTFFVITQPFFDLSDWLFFRIPLSINWRIEHEKSWFWCLFKNVVFLAGKWAWPSCWPKRVCGLKTQSNSWPFLGKPLSRNSVFKISRPKSPDLLIPCSRATVTVKKWEVLETPCIKVLITREYYSRVYYGGLKCWWLK